MLHERGVAPRPVLNFIDEFFIDEEGIRQMIGYSSKSDDELRDWAGVKAPLRLPGVLGVNYQQQLDWLLRVSNVTLTAGLFEKLNSSQAYQKFLTNFRSPKTLYVDLGYPKVPYRLALEDVQPRRHFLEPGEIQDGKEELAEGFFEFAEPFIKRGTHCAIFKDKESHTNALHITTLKFRILP
ncbi:hypothetical protein F4781DRAFT_442765 [Annulohypoxylon bovei var. microspora]|nr:hypothetical protein F4781DRAFT_442765 [Annulohypoxylon bovei var. microspora]